MRICAPRSATSATRLIASVSSATPTVATAVCSAGSSCRNFGNSASSSRLVVRLPVAADTQQPVLADRRTRTERQVHVAAVGARLGCLGQGLRRCQDRRLDVCRIRRPGQLPHGQAEPIGGRQNDLLTGDLDPDAGEHRQRVVAARGDGHLADGLVEELGGDHAGLVGERGQRRVVLDGHRGQREPRAAAAQQYPGALDADVDGLGGQCPGDVRQQPAGYQNASRRSDFGGNAEPRPRLRSRIRRWSARRRSRSGARRRAPARWAWWAGCGQPTPRRRRSLPVPGETSNR